MRLSDFIQTMTIDGIRITAWGAYSGAGLARVRLAKEEEISAARAELDAMNEQHSKWTLAEKQYAREVKEHRSKEKIYRHAERERAKAARLYARGKGPAPCAPWPAPVPPAPHSIPPVDGMAYRTCSDKVRRLASELSHLKPLPPRVVDGGPIRALARQVEAGEVTLERLPDDSYVVRVETRGKGARGHYRFVVGEYVPADTAREYCADEDKWLSMPLNVRHADLGSVCSDGTHAWRTDGGLYLFRSNAPAAGRYPCRGARPEYSREIPPPAELLRTSSGGVPPEVIMTVVAGVMLRAVTLAQDVGRSQYTRLVFSAGNAVVQPVVEGAGDEAEIPFQTLNLALGLDIHETTFVFSHDYLIKVLRGVGSKNLLDIVIFRRDPSDCGVLYLESVEEPLSGAMMVGCRL